MKISLAQLRESDRRKFYFSGTQEELGLTHLEFPIYNTEVMVTLSDAEHGYYLHGDLATTTRLACDRCLTEIDYDIETPLAALVVIDDSKEFMDEEIIEVPATALHIDIKSFVEDSIVLVLPFKILCKDDCKGLCAQCGTNLNESSCDCNSTGIDPRWNKLRELNLEE